MNTTIPRIVRRLLVVLALAMIVSLLRDVGHRAVPAVSPRP